MLQVKIEDVFGAGNRWRKDLTEVKKMICRDVGGVHTGIYVGKEPRAVHVRSVQFKWNTASIFKKMIKSFQTAERIFADFIACGMLSEV